MKIFARTFRCSFMEKQREKEREWIRMRRKGKKKESFSRAGSFGYTPNFSLPPPSFPFLYCDEQWWKAARRTMRRTQEDKKIFPGTSLKSALQIGGFFSFLILVLSRLRELSSLLVPTKQPWRFLSWHLRLQCWQPTFFVGL